MLSASLSALDYATVATGAVLFLGLAYAALVSRREGERLATIRAALFSLLLPLPYLLTGLTAFRFQAVVEIVLLALTAILVVVLLAPYGGLGLEEDDTPRERIDERDIMFARNVLEPGTPRFEAYYAENPDKRAPDDAFRAKPGLLGIGTTAYDPYCFASAKASFRTIEKLRPFVDGEVSGERVVSDPAEISRYLKRWAIKLGAVTAGITELQDYHMYSVVGRGDQYGRPVELNHEFALALTVEMDKEMLDRAPLGPTVMESAQQYVVAGVIAVQIAEFIRKLGYGARAHIDGNYRVVCPLVARDAGLGEIGRMGLLMTPELGPRVRLGVVTTEMPLVVDERARDGSMIDFCARCRKCAEVCPAGAISLEDRKEIDGVRRWQIDSEACFTFWCHVGTDCARCVSACPYSHPDNLLHDFVRSGVRRNSLFRRLAVQLDDVFYGRRPPPAKLLDWMKLEPRS